MVSETTSHAVGNIQQFIDALGESLDFSDPKTSFSPFDSDIGLKFDSTPGIPALFIHYNRVTTALGEPFLALEGELTGEKRGVLGVKQEFSHGEALIAFCNRNTWIIEAKGLPGVRFRFDDPAAETLRKSKTHDGRTRFIEGSLPTLDKRDSDTHFPFLLGMRVIVGNYTGGDGLQVPIRYKPDSDGRLVLACCFQAHDVDIDRMLNLLMNTPASAERARRMTRDWLSLRLGAFRCRAESERELKVTALAAMTLLFNTVQAPGILAGRRTHFPNRGEYPVHYLWDTAFQNLALEMMDSALAEDSLLALASNIRPDGKIPQFVASTWVRPRESQPPLMGWAALRLFKKTGDKDFVNDILPSLMRNTVWWLNQYMTKYGLVRTLNPLESGWDDSPRWDNGPIIACDMNSYLLMQIRACASLAAAIGDERTARAYLRQTDAMADAISAVLYDSETNRYRDVCAADGEPVEVSTPAQFLPLWAGVPLDDSQSLKMLREGLLDEQTFFGKYPFPSVAYSDPKYQPDKWWRGPVWPPVAWLMLETLKAYGLDDEWKIAAERVYSMIQNDGGIHELFNADNGEGLGSPQQSWTAAVFLKLQYELHGEDTGKAR